MEHVLASEDQLSFGAAAMLFGIVQRFDCVRFNDGIRCE